MATMIPSDAPGERLNIATVLPFAPGVEPEEAPACGVKKTANGLSGDSRPLSFLLEASAALASAPNAESALSLILSRLVTQEHLTLARVFRPNEVEGDLREVASGDKGENSRSVVPLAGAALAAWVFRHHQEVYIPRAEHDLRCQESLRENLKSAYAVPLRVAAKVVGVLEIASVEPGGIRPATRRLLDQLASQVAPVLGYQWVKEETSRLQRQLFQAQKMEALGALTGGIVHDFNNLLNVALGFASLARQQIEPSDPLQDSLNMIEESAQLAADLARQLLAFSRPQKQQEKPVCVQEVVHRIGRIVERTFDRSIRVKFAQTGDPIWVRTESSYLEQALLNLCLNARDAMPNGGALTIEVDLPAPGGEFSSRTRTQNCVRISVQDTGAGIPSELLPKIFDPFFTTKTPERGTGLGLAMVCGFVRSHHGEIKAETVPGNGSRFTMTLPTSSAPSPQATNKAPTVEGAGGTVLVVDDEPLVRAFAMEALNRLGYQVLPAENGVQALEMYTRHPGKIDCVLMDLVMPELSGLETFRRIRRLDPEACIVFASGCSTGEILCGAPDAEKEAFLGKPYTLRDLAGAMCKAIPGKRTRSRRRKAGKAPQRRNPATLHE